MRKKICLARVENSTTSIGVLIYMIGSNAWHMAIRDGNKITMSVDNES